MLLEVFQNEESGVRHGEVTKNFFFWSQVEFFWQNLCEIMCFPTKNGRHFESFLWLHLQVRCFYGAHLHYLVPSPNPQVEAMFGGKVA